MSRFGDVEDEPVTFVAVRAAAMLVATVALLTVAFGDPLWFAVAYGVPLAAAYGLAAYYVRRILA